MDIRSIDWQSLTFIGERHEVQLRITGPDAHAGADRLCEGIEEAEFDIPGQTVADIAVAGRSECSQDGSVNVTIHALTIAE